MSVSWVPEDPRKLCSDSCLAHRRYEEIHHAVLRCYLPQSVRQHKLMERSQQEGLHMACILRSGQLL